MSPAGTKESFIAAVKTGADAVYTGLKEFNARITVLTSLPGQALVHHKPCPPVICLIYYP